MSQVDLLMVTVMPYELCTSTTYAADDVVTVMAKAGARNAQKRSNIEANIFTRLSPAYAKIVRLSRWKSRRAYSRNGALAHTTLWTCWRAFGFINMD